MLSTVGIDLLQIRAWGHKCELRDTIGGIIVVDGNTDLGSGKYCYRKYQKQTIDNEYLIKKQYIWQLIVLYYGIISDTTQGISGAFQHVYKR